MTNCIETIIDQKRALELLELEVQVTVSHLIRVLGTQDL